ncbi:hypothetical protein M3G15_10505 [Paenibacillus sp. p3-SID1389]|uniref:DUF6809 family protein n=1 Tax=Paenibacillus sp. p3-SID1389 TaxID=2916364 RepID=UPI0021A75B30|nr:DUF6809 family protein [Paenibacillus sp. p3-SID1389]MCT2195568.1 hypothetical protein [Paenibacillus sp. p3-SID1389]
MRSLIEELYTGHILPDEMIVSRDPKYRPLCRQISELTESWRKKLTEEEFSELEYLMDLQAQANDMHSMAVFKYGFRLGASLLTEVLTGTDELVRHPSTP